MRKILIIHVFIDAYFFYEQYSPLKSQAFLLKLIHNINISNSF